jgi:predicted membrane GTPase involved in stress response
MIAERDNETYRAERESRLLIVAKAKIFASEGWKVVITDHEGKAYQAGEFDRLLAA